MNKQTNKTTTLNKATNPPENIFLIKDEFGQETYLRIQNCLTLEDIRKLYIHKLEHSKVIEYLNRRVTNENINESPLRMDAIEWGIRQQFMTLLTDDEIAEYKKQKEGIATNQ